MNLWTQTRRRGRGLHWLAFVLLVLASSCRWLLTGVRPDAEPTFASLAMGCGWATVVAVMLLRRGPARAMLQRSWRDVAAGALLFAGPSLGALLHARSLDATSLTMALALTPVAVGVAAAALGSGGLDGAAGRIWPGLAAVGGLLLLLAEPNLKDPLADVALFLAPVLTGFGAALFSAKSGAEGRSTVWQVIAWRAASGLLGGTAVFAAALLANSLQTHTRPVVALPALACDGVLALLSVFALAQVGALRWSAQFTLLPLLIVLEGTVLVRPALSTRWVVGVALLAVASVYLLLPPVEEIAPVVPKDRD